MRIPPVQDRCFLLSKARPRELARCVTACFSDFLNFSSWMLRNLILDWSGTLADDLGPVVRGHELDLPPLRQGGTIARGVPRMLSVARSMRSTTTCMPGVASRELEPLFCKHFIDCQHAVSCSSRMRSSFFVFRQVHGAGFSWSVRSRRPSSRNKNPPGSGSRIFSSKIDTTDAGVIARARLSAVKSSVAPPTSRRWTRRPIAEYLSHLLVRSLSVEAEGGISSRPYEMPGYVIGRVMNKRGRLRVFDRFEAAETALVVIDMQKFYVSDVHPRLTSSPISIDWPPPSGPKEQWLPW